MGARAVSGVLALLAAAGVTTGAQGGGNKTLTAVPGIKVGHHTLAERPTGCTVILTTHILDVAERLVDRIGIIQSGRLLTEGTLDELRLFALELLVL